MSGYDPSKHLVQHRRTKEVVLKVGDDELSVIVRVDNNDRPNIPWSLRNQLISKALRWDENNIRTFDADLYLRECLKALIVQAPWGNTDDMFLSQVGDELGAALQDLVPKAFAPEEKVYSAENIKKEPISS